MKAQFMPQLPTAAADVEMSYQPEKPHQKNQPHDKELIEQLIDEKTELLIA